MKIAVVSADAAAKIDRILTEGRLNIRIPDEGLEARTRGDHGWWTTKLFKDGSGSCECPAWTRSNRLVCTHLLSLQRVAEMPL